MISARLCRLRRFRQNESGEMNFYLQPRNLFWKPIKRRYLWVLRSQLCDNHGSSIRSFFASTSMDPLTDFFLFHPELVWRQTKSVFGLLEAGTFFRMQTNRIPEMLNVFMTTRYLTPSNVSRCLHLPLSLPSHTSQGCKHVNVLDTTSRVIHFSLAEILPKKKRQKYIKTSLFNGWTRDITRRNIYSWFKMLFYCAVNLAEEISAFFR